MRHLLRRDRNARERSNQPARLFEGQRVMGWRGALTELDTAYSGRLRSCPGRV